jgi:hypothetical protein
MGQSGRSPLATAAGRITFGGIPLQLGLAESGSRRQHPDTITLPGHA